MNITSNKLLALLIILGSFQSTLSQNADDKIEQLKSNKLLYSTFNQFYTDSIRQETKDEWGEPYFQKIDQINGVHYFDYNNDGLEDAFVEFSVRNSDGGSFYYLVAVLFENTENKYIYKAHFEPGNLLFEKFNQPSFIFSGKVSRFSEETITQKYKLVNNTFQELIK